MSYNLTIIKSWIPKIAPCLRFVERGLYWLLFLSIVYMCKFAYLITLACHRRLSFVIVYLYWIPLSLLICNVIWCVFVYLVCHNDNLSKIVLLRHFYRSYDYRISFEFSFEGRLSSSLDRNYFSFEYRHVYFIAIKLHFRIYHTYLHSH